MLRGRLLIVMAALAAFFAAATSPQAGQPAAPTIRITSPLGRLASSGAVRIVAQATTADGTTPQKVAFFVGDVSVGEDPEGPVYAVEWIDENPFESVTIRAEVVAGDGRRAEDRVVLPALDMKDETSIASVLLDVSVMDDKGRHVAGLTRTHFGLSEEGVAQNIELAETSRVPTVVTLLVDTSQSMSTRFDFVRRATRHLAGVLREGDQLAVVPFARSVGAVTGPTRDLHALTSAIDGLTSRGGTAIADALRETADRLSDATGRQVIVLITDGYDEHSASALDQAAAAVVRLNATLYTVGIGGAAGVSFRGREALKRVAGQTGGRAFFPMRDAELPLVQEHIYNDVRHRYLLTYTPSNQVHDGTWRSVNVITSDPTHLVKTRAGYFAQAPAPIRPSIEFTVTSTGQDAVVVSREDLRAVEDGVPQTIDAFQEASAPVAVLLALDESGSMRPIADDVRAAALSFVAAVRDEDRLGVLTFSNSAALVTDLTLSRAAPAMTVTAYKTSGGTALFDAVALGLSRLATVEGRRVMVLLTDGRDENAAGTARGSVQTLPDLLAKLREVDVAVFAIGLGPGVDRHSLEELALTSGGEAYFPATVAELPDHYRRVVEHLRRRYVIGYTSTNATSDGAWRSVTLEATRPGLRVTSRGGYRAPGS